MRPLLARSAKADPPQSGRNSRARKGSKPGLDIAFVNNMPEAAFRATERQFAGLVRAAAGRTPVRLHLFSMADPGQNGLAEGYAPCRSMLGRSFDAAIVTGREPRAPRLDQEPYWRDLAEIVDWAKGHTRSTIFSCLAAHAAVLHLDGIERRRLPEKLSGVFDCAVAGAHPLLDGSGGRVLTPHSRLNALVERDLASRGYTVLTRSEEAGVDAFILERDSLFVFLQGHPEYDTDTLLREYRRDVGRFLKGERDDYPREPDHYFSEEANAVLRAFRRRALANRREDLIEVFPNIATPFAIANRWNAGAARFYRNWLGELLARKARAQAMV